MSTSNLLDSSVQTRSRSSFGQFLTARLRLLEQQGILITRHQLSVATGLNQRFITELREDNFYRSADWIKSDENREKFTKLAAMLKLPADVVLTLLSQQLEAGEIIVSSEVSGFLSTSPPAESADRLMKRIDAAVVEFYDAISQVNLKESAQYLHQILQDLKTLFVEDALHVGDKAAWIGANRRIASIKRSLRGVLQDISRIQVTTIEENDDCGIAERLPQGRGNAQIDSGAFEAVMWPLTDARRKSATSNAERQSPVSIDHVYPKCVVEIPNDLQYLRSADWPRNPIPAREAEQVTAVWRRFLDGKNMDEVQAGNDSAKSTAYASILKRCRNAINATSLHISNIPIVMSDVFHRKVIEDFVANNNGAQALRFYEELARHGVTAFYFYAHYINAPKEMMSDNVQANIDLLDMRLIAQDYLHRYSDDSASAQFKGIDAMKKFEGVPTLSVNGASNLESQGKGQIDSERRRRVLEARFDFHAREYVLNCDMAKTSWQGTLKAIMRATTVEEATSTFKFANSRYDFAWIHSAYARTLVRFGKYDDAIAEGRRALEIQQSRSNLASIPNTLQYLVSKPDYAAHLAVGLAYFYRGEYLQATKRLLQVIDLCPFEPEAYLRLADSLQRLNEFGEARRVLEEGLQYRPGNFAMAQSLIAITVKTGNMTKAKYFADNARARFPNDLWIAYNSACVYSRYAWLGLRSQADQVEKCLETAAAYFGTALEELRKAGELDEVENQGTTNIYAAAAKDFDFEALAQLHYWLETDNRVRRMKEINPGKIKVVDELEQLCKEFNAMTAKAINRNAVSGSTSAAQ